MLTRECMDVSQCQTVLVTGLKIPFRVAFKCMQAWSTVRRATSVLTPSHGEVRGCGWSWGVTLRHAVLMYQIPRESQLGSL